MYVSLSLVTIPLFHTVPLISTHSVGPRALGFGLLGLYCTTPYFTGLLG
jgi:hypothetical protein